MRINRGKYLWTFWQCGILNIFPLFFLVWLDLKIWYSSSYKSFYSCTSFTVDRLLTRLIKHSQLLSISSNRFILSNSVFHNLCLWKSARSHYKLLIYIILTFPLEFVANKLPIIRSSTLCVIISWNTLQWEEILERYKSYKIGLLHLQILHTWRLSLRQCVVSAKLHRCSSKIFLRWIQFDLVHRTDIF